MAAELIKTLVPAHCLGSIWSERDNREREYLAPTVRDTVTQDNTVANCILVTCLGDLSMTAQDRARVVELWVWVAEECRGLGNFSSLHTILYALQSPTFTRLQDTWGQVSRESCRTFKKWCRREQRVNRELLMQLGSVQTLEKPEVGDLVRFRAGGGVKAAGTGPLAGTGSSLSSMGP
nr:PREDICTED: ral guanine nucleotide dissociation stimulator-like [Equus przewalskii]